MFFSGNAKFNSRKLYLTNKVIWYGIQRKPFHPNLQIGNKKHGNNCFNNLIETCQMYSTRQLKRPNNPYFCFSKYMFSIFRLLCAVKKIGKVDMRSLLYVFTLLLPSNPLVLRVRPFTIVCTSIFCAENFFRERWDMLQCYNKNCNKISLSS